MILGYIGLNLKTRRYFYLSGRSPRSEYIIYYLFLSVAGFLFSIFGTVAIFVLTRIFSTFGFPLVPMLLGLLFCAYLGLPMLFISVRRMHDIGISGLWILAPILLAFICAAIIILNEKFGYSIPSNIADFLMILAGVIQVLILFASVFVKGSAGDNKYGPNPTL